MQNSPGRSGMRCPAGVVTAWAQGLDDRRDPVPRAGTARRVPSTSGARDCSTLRAQPFRSKILKQITSFRHAAYY